MVDEERDGLTLLHGVDFWEAAHTWVEDGAGAAEVGPGQRVQAVRARRKQRHAWAQHLPHLYPHHRMRAFIVSWQHAGLDHCTGEMSDSFRVYTIIRTHKDTTKVSIGDLDRHVKKKISGVIPHLEQSLGTVRKGSWVLVYFLFISCIHIGHILYRTLRSVGKLGNSSDLTVRMFHPAQIGCALHLPFLAGTFPWKVSSRTHAHSTLYSFIMW